MPDAVPHDSARDERAFYPPRQAAERPATLPALLSKALIAFGLEFNRDVPAPLALSANVLRVVTDEGVRAGELAELTGCSPETSAIGWRLERFVVVASVKGRGKLVRLSAMGTEAQRAYPRVARRIESGWEQRFGEQVMDDLCAALRGLYRRDAAGRSRFAEGLVPPDGVRRAGGDEAALGLLARVPAEVTRTREMAPQTRAFHQAGCSGFRNRVVRL